VGYQFLQKSPKNIAAEKRSDSDGHWLQRIGEVTSSREGRRRSLCSCSRWALGSCWSPQALRPSGVSAIRIPRISAGRDGRPREGGWSVGEVRAAVARGGAGSIDNRTFRIRRRVCGVFSRHSEILFPGCSMRTWTRPAFQHTSISATCSDLVRPVNA
jgi:hypothetical protein